MAALSQSGMATHKLHNLQAMRAVAALMVMAMHFFIREGAIFDTSQEPLHFITRLLASAGGAGVDIFFVISGFIMCGAAGAGARRQAVALPRFGLAWRFLVRRAARIYPLYWFVIASLLTMCGDPMYRTALIGIVTSPSVMFLATTKIPVLQQAWTLVFEVCFYCVVAAAIIISPRHITRVLWCWIAIEACLVAAAYFLPGTAGLWGALCGSIFVKPQILEFGIGILVYSLCRHTAADYAKLAQAAAALIFGTGVSLCFWQLGHQGSLNDPERLLFYGCPAGLLIYGLTVQEFRTGRVLPVWLQTIGDWSYSIYLWHFPVMDFVRALWSWAALPDTVSWETHIALECTITLLLSAFSYHVVERPAIELGRRLTRQRPGQQGLASLPSAVEPLTEMFAETTYPQKVSYGARFNMRVYGMIFPRALALLYALFATLALLLIASAMPPMQNADEANHSYRADQISHFGLVAQRLPDGEIGGDVDAGLPAIKSATAVLPFHREAKVTRAMYVPVLWGTPEPVSFPNTAIYPPFFYLPAAAMAALSRQLNIPLPHALVLMRLAMGATSIAIGTMAVALAGNAAIWLFAILLLPMSMASSAAVTQDGPMLACTALAAALSLWLRNPQARWRRSAFVTMCLLFAAVAMARPPYAAFGLLTLAAPARLWVRLGGLAGILLCVVAWSTLNASYVVLPVPPTGQVNPVSQLLGLAMHPWRLVTVALATCHATGGFLRESFIGLLGWLDVNLPPAYHHAAWAVLALAAISALFAGAGPGRLRDAILAALAMLAACAGLGLIQYLTWTIVGAPAIDGLQGRYFLPPALLLGVVLGRAKVSSSTAAIWLATPVLMFPVASIAITMHALLIRYYF